MDLVESSGSTALSRPERIGVGSQLPGSALPRFQQVTAALALAPTVSIVLPVMNEAANLPHVFASLPAWVTEIVLVDGHSTDDTVAVARQLRPDIKIICQEGSGKGNALLAGFAASTGEIIVTIDGDGSNDGREIVHFVSALAAGADFVKGSRFASSGGSDDITAGRRLGNWVLAVLVNRMFGTQYTDLCYGYNAFWARHLHALAVECSGFEVETLMNIRAAKAGLRVHEVPSFERPRIHGSSKLRVVNDGWRILRVILREKFAAGERQSGRQWPVPTVIPRLETAGPAAVPEPRRPVTDTDQERR